MISHEIYDEWGWFIDTESINSDNNSIVYNQIIKKYKRFKVVETETTHLYNDYRLYKKLYTIKEEEDIENNDNTNNNNNDKNQKDFVKKKIIKKFYSKLISTLLFTVIFVIYYTSFKLTSYTT